MLDKETYCLMKKQYWMVWSWAVWWAQKTTPRSNTDDMSWVNDSNLLSIINTGYVFVWLNWSSTHWDKWAINNIDWSNFHSGYSLQNDYKLRYALKDTKYRWSYLTDLIKYYPEVDSWKVWWYLRKNPQVILDNISNFKKEISYLWDNLILVAMGSKVYELLNKYLWNEYTIYCIKHYSYTIWKEDYRKEVLEILWK